MASLALHFGGAALLWAKLPALFEPPEPLTPKELTIEIVQAIPPAPKPVVTPRPAPPKPEKKPAKKPKPVEKKRPAKKPVQKKPPKPAPKKPAPRPRPTIRDVAPPPRHPTPPAEPAPSTPQQETPPPATVSNAIVQAEKQSYRSALRAAILAQQKYPRQAQRRRMEGTVTVGFTLLKNGSIQNIHVQQSSGHRLLDKAATNAVKRVGHFKPIPEKYKKSRWEFEIPVVFKLR